MLRSPLIAPAARDEVATLFVGFELSKKTWLIGLYAPELGKRISRHKIDGGDVDAALELIATAKRRLEKLGRHHFPGVSAGAKARLAGAAHLGLQPPRLEPPR